MAPFPETEIMTLKRLEVAIRKMDFKLLKDGAYKLHEKYHGGHRFEYIDLLKEIYSNIMGNIAIPRDIKDILMPTIEDILNAQDTKIEEQIEQEPLQNRVSSLTSLSYSAKALNSPSNSADSNTAVITPEEKHQEERKISAYDAFGTPRTGTSTPEIKNNLNNIISDNQLESEMMNQTMGVEMETIQPIQEEIEAEMKNVSIPVQTKEQATEENNPNTLINQNSFETKPFREFYNSPALDNNQKINTVEENKPQIEPKENEVQPEIKKASAFSFDINSLSLAKTAEENKTETNIENKTETETTVQNSFTSEVNKPSEQKETREFIPSYLTRPAHQAETTRTNFSQIGLEPENQNTNEIKKETKTVTLFFSQDSSRDKIKNITQLRELISKTKSEHISLDETLNLISEIKTQSDTNVMELKTILGQFKILKNKLNFVTNSSSSNLIELLEEMDFSYSFVEREEGKNLNLIPLFGLSALFTCSNCSETYLHKTKDNNPLILSCPKCKNPMYPTFYAVDGINVEMNTNYYNYALKSFAGSKVWLLIHPGLNDIFTINMLKTALSVSNCTEEVYILDKDINVRETYKKALLESLPEGRKIFIDTQMNALEVFFNSIK